MQLEVTSEEIKEALRRTLNWKAPGVDNLPAGFLKACGEPLFSILAKIATASFQIGFFPQEFKYAKTIVLQKPEKTPGTYQTPRGYRPIALLSNLGKAIEAVLAIHIIRLAEKHQLLPDKQIGGHTGRFIETAIRLLTAQIEEA